MRGNHQRFLFCVPKSEQPIFDLVEQSAELPNIRAFQLLEQFGILLSICHTLDVAVYLLRCITGQSFDEAVRFLRLEK